MPTVEADRCEHVLVLAKAPVPGRVKTRLHVAFTPEEAASIADAALRDTLDAATACRARRHLVALDGEVGSWAVDSLEVYPQEPGSFAQRLDGAWSHVTGPCVQIGMDTPQVTPSLLDEGLDALTHPGVDAVLGLALDGGWWALGLRTPLPGVFDGVAMSVDDTGEQQLAALRRRGLRVHLLPTLRDLDRPDDVAAIADAHPHLRVSIRARELAGAGR